MDTNTSDDEDISNLNFEDEPYIETDDEAVNIPDEDAIAEIDESSEEYNVDKYLITEVKESDKKLPELIKQADAQSQQNTQVATVNKNEVAVSNGQMPPLEYGGMANLDNDFDLARKNLIQLTQAGNSVVEDLVALAKSSEHPNAYKTLTETLTAISQLNKDLLELYERKTGIDNKSNKQKPNNTQVENSGTVNNTQNNVFVGTTDDLFDLIEKKGLITLGQTPTNVVNVGEEQ